MSTRSPLPLLGLILFACAPSSVTLEDPSTRGYRVVVTLDGARVPLSVQGAAIDAEVPLRRAIGSGTAYVAVFTVGAPIDAAGAPIAAPRAALDRACACAIPALGGPPILTPGDACPLPLEHQAALFGVDGEREDDAAAQRTREDLLRRVVISGDDGCRPRALPHGLAARGALCDLAPAPYPDDVAVDGDGTALAVGDGGQLRAFPLGDAPVRWSEVGARVARGARGGGFLVAGATGGAAYAERVRLGADGPSRSALRMEAAMTRVDLATRDEPSGEDWLLGRDGGDHPVIAACDDARCAPRPVPCGLPAVSSYGMRPDGTLGALLDEQRLAWRADDGWTCARAALPEGPATRAVALASRVLLFAPRSDDRGGALYAAPLPLGAEPTWTLVSQLDGITEPYSYYLDDGGAWLVDRDHTAVVSADGRVERVPTRTLPELGALGPRGWRRAGTWQVSRVASGHLLVRQGASAWRTTEPLAPGDAPLLALDDGRALALAHDGPLVLDTTSGCASATVTPAPDYGWPAAELAVRAPDDPRVMLAGSAPAPWVEWRSLRDGERLGAPQVSPGGRAWVDAAAFSPGRAALVDDDGAVYVTGPEDLRRLEPITDDPATAESDTNDTERYRRVFGCDGVAWVAGDGAEALARVVTDGVGGHRLEAYWGSRAQRARSGGNVADELRHLAVHCIAANDVLITAFVRTAVLTSVATARYEFLRDTTVRTVADSAGRSSDRPSLGWAGTPTALYFLQVDSLTFLTDELSLPTPLTAYADTPAGTYLSFGGPARRFAFVAPR